MTSLIFSFNELFSTFAFFTFRENYGARNDSGDSAGKLAKNYICLHLNRNSAFDCDVKNLIVH